MKKPILSRVILSLTLFSAILTMRPTSLHAQALTPETKPVGSAKVQLVFCLDVTGSMSGLINTARQKIWSIASSVMQSNEQPDLQIGLVFYRDKGDAFITRKVEITGDLDSVYLKLMEMTADGGGDGPEAVNHGLYESVKKMNWNMDTQVYRAVFLVGDCGPHMDYKDDVKYPETVKLAKKSDIIINTILMGGGCAGSREVWRDVAALTAGDYFEVGYDAGGYVVSTPYDGELATLQARLDSMVLYYGDRHTVAVQNTKFLNTTTINASSVKVSEKASRASFKTTAVDKSYYKNDLLTDLKTGTAKIETLDTSHLPAKLKTMPVTARKAYVDSLSATRDSLQMKMKAIDKKRQEYITIETNKVKGSASNTFSSGVYNSIQNQSAKKKIVLTGKAKE